MWKSGPEVTLLDSIEWLNEKHIKGKLDHADLKAIARKDISKYRKRRYELVDEPKNKPTEFFYKII